VECRGVKCSDVSNLLGRGQGPSLLRAPEGLAHEIGGLAGGDAGVGWGREHRHLRGGNVAGHKLQDTEMVDLSIDPLEVRWGDVVGVLDRIDDLGLGLAEGLAGCRAGGIAEIRGCLDRHSAISDSLDVHKVGPDLLVGRLEGLVEHVTVGGQADVEAHGLRDFVILHDLIDWAGYQDGLDLADVFCLDFGFLQAGKTRTGHWTGFLSCCVARAIWAPLTLCRALPLESRVFFVGRAGGAGVVLCRGVACRAVSCRGV